MSEWIPIILSTVAAIVSIYSLTKDWRLGKPDALSRYEDLVNKLTERVDSLENELEDYRIGVVILINQMQEVGIKPKWQPKERKDKA